MRHFRLLPVRLALFLCLLMNVGSSPTMAEDWPQWRGENRDGVWSEKGLIKEFDSDEIEVRWRQPIGEGYSGPTVADGRVFVMDRLIERQKGPENVERILCFDSKSGIPIWNFEYECEYTIRYPSGPRASVSIDDNRAYALGAMGHIHCLDAGTGTLLWKRDLNRELSISTELRDTNRMPTWGIAASPLVYDDLVILHVGGSDGACVIALDKKSGEEEWRALDDRAQYSAPVLTRQAGKDVLICWTGDNVVGLDPSKGKVYWKVPMTPMKGPIGVASPVINNDTVFVTSFYDGAMMLQLLPDALQVRTIWQARGKNELETKAIQSIISTPLVKDGYIYGVDSHGEFRCLDAKTGERIWEDGTAVPHGRWGTIHFVQNGETTWMFNETGELIIAKLSPKGFQEVSRARLIKPSNRQARRRNGVCWAHPAFAEKSIFARNDKELVCASLED